MCTGIVENTKVSGSGKGQDEWYALDQVSVSYDHPDHAHSESAVIIDFLNEAVGPKARIAIELTPESARSLVHVILASLYRGEGEGVHGKEEPAR